jgi:1-deoxy-D-xylulose 5-phosphate reductoisomerase
MVKGGKKLNIPIVIGSSGGAGGEPHIRWSLDILKEIAAEEGLNFKLAVIHSEQDKDYLKKKLSENKIKPLGPVKALTEEAIEKSVRVVAMMGAEPMMQALKAGAEVVLAGRASDSAIFAAPALLKNYPKAAAWHLGNKRGRC